jgi:hypothetical protein
LEKLTTNYQPISDNQINILLMQPVIFYSKERKNELATGIETVPEGGTASVLILVLGLSPTIRCSKKVMIAACTNFPSMAISSLSVDVF